MYEYIYSSASNYVNGTGVVEVELIEIPKVDKIKPLLLINIVVNSISKSGSFAQREIYLLKQFLFAFFV
jgi:hypothetical protein